MIKCELSILLNDLYDPGKRYPGLSGKEYELSSSIDRDEFIYIYNLIRESERIQNTLEVGFKFGMSSLSICLALKDRSSPTHTIIDPKQKSIWDGVGVLNLEEKGIKFFELIEKGSEFALPSLLEKGEERFDLVFIDGWHTFDHTLLDCFYATRLLKRGGVLIVDDINWPSVSRAVKFIMNYPCYEEVGSVRSAGTTKMKALRKMFSDDRSYKWHTDNF